MPETRIGISGWRYAPWRGVFYPKGLAQRRELEYASRQMNSLEINGSFYSLQTPDSYHEWYSQTPDDFVFAVKGSRYITHMKKLKDVETPLANFFASGLLRLAEKLGPILWQFPPVMQFYPERFETFFELLPRDTRSAAKLAARHDEKLAGRSYVKTDRKRPIRHAVEIRHESFCSPEFVALCRRHNVAIVFTDTAGRWPYMEDLTADFVYCRLHGHGEIYVGGYDEAALEWWADRIRLWQAGRQPVDVSRVTRDAPGRVKRDAYVYFDNDVKVRAPFDAMNLASRLAGSSQRVQAPEVAPRPAPPPGSAYAVRSRWPGFRRSAPARAPQSGHS